MTASAWAGVELVATAVALGAMVALHLLPTGLSPAHHPVSQYGIGGYRLGYRVLTVALGAAGLAAAALVAVAYPPQQRQVIVALFTVFGLCRLAISWWPMDAPGEPRSKRGTIHVALAAGAFATATIAANQLQHIAGQLAPMAGAGYRYAVGAAFWLLVTGLLGMLVARRVDAQHRWFGAAERLVYAGTYLLLFATGVSAL